METKQPLQEEVSFPREQVMAQGEKELRELRRTLAKTANQVSSTVKRHPARTVSLIISACALLGGGLYAAFRPRPTRWALFARRFRNAFAR